MAKEEEMFKKPVEVAPPKKKKKKLTQAQLDGLAKGRAKMAEKRAAEKARKAANMKAEKENQQTQKKERKQKKETISKDEAILAKILEKEKAQRMEAYEKQQQRKHKIERFSAIKYKWLEKCNSKAEYDEFNKVMNGVNEDMMCDDDKLVSYLNGYLEKSPAGQVKSDVKTEKNISKDNVSITVNDQ